MIVSEVYKLSFVGFFFVILAESSDKREYQ